MGLFIEALERYHHGGRRAGGHSEMYGASSTRVGKDDGSRDHEGGHGPQQGHYRCQWRRGPPIDAKVLYDTLTIPDLLAVEVSFDRSRLLIQSGTDVAAMALERRSLFKPRTA